jgi:hypothetical protein
MNLRVRVSSRPVAKISVSSWLVLAIVEPQRISRILSSRAFPRPSPVVLLILKLADNLQQTSLFLFLTVDDLSEPFAFLLELGDSAFLLLGGLSLIFFDKLGVSFFGCLVLDENGVDLL